MRGFGGEGEELQLVLEEEEAKEVKEGRMVGQKVEREGGEGRRRWEGRKGGWEERK